MNIYTPFYGLLQGYLPQLFIFFFGFLCRFSKKRLSPLRIFPQKPLVTQLSLQKFLIRKFWFSGIQDQMDFLPLCPVPE